MNEKEQFNKNLIIKNEDNIITDNVMSPEFIDKIRLYFQTILKRELEKGFEDESNIEKRVEGEKSFYLKILNLVDNVISKNPSKKIITLFDLDDTLVRNKFYEDNTFRTVIRPSAVDLLIKIKGSEYE